MSFNLINKRENKNESENENAFDMGEINNALTIIAGHLTNQAQMIDANNEKIIMEIYNRFVRPLQESEVMKNIEVAKRLKVSPALVTQLIATGKIPTTIDGRVTKYHLWKYITQDGKN